MPPSHAALIVDSDPQGLESLVYGFQGADWRITACQAPETASLLVKASGAELVVVAARAEPDKAHALLAQLRAKDTLRTLPILVLGPEAMRSSLKEHGNVDLLPMPTFVRDVLTASRLLVAPRPSTAQVPTEEPGFAGFECPVTTAATLSMIRTMGGLARSGMLQLERKDRRGEILFREGELTLAQVGQLQSMAALQHLLLWNDGALKLRLRPVARRGQMHQKAQEFLEEFERFQRDYNHAIKDIGPASTIYTTDEERLSRSTAEVPAEVTPVVRLCDGQRSIADVIDESPFRVLDTARILGRLVDLGVLVRRNAKPASNEALARTDLDAFWETARVGGELGPSGQATSAAAPAALVASTDSMNTPAPAPSEGPPATVSAQDSIEAAAAAAVAAAGTTTARAPEPEQRGKQANRREGERRSLRETLQLGAKLGGLFRANTTETHDKAAPADSLKMKESAKPSAEAPGTRASGTIELRQGERRSQPTMRGFADRRSVVIDIPVEAVEASSEQPASALVAANPIESKPVETKPVESRPVVVAKTPAPGVVVVESKASESSGARITGVLQVAPSKRLTRDAPSSSRVSIQLDASLESPPATPVVPANPPNETKSAPSRTRTPIATLVLSSGGARPKGRTPLASPSVHVGPVVSGAPAATNPKSRPSGGMSSVSGQIKSRPSGTFSAVESDFFERESELYRVETAESFTDLDEGAPKSGGKNGSGKKNEKKRRK
jgi:hypothetical protein